MSKSAKMKVASQNIEAILEALANANCPNGCKCVFCRTFDQGVKAGMDDAAIMFGRALDDLKRKAGLA